MNIGATIKQLRQREKMSQEDLASCLGVSTQAVSRWETGITFPDITLIPKLADIFNCTTDMILCCENNTIDREIDQIIEKANKELKNSDYHDYSTPLKIVKEMLLKYPNNERLIIETLHRITAYAFEIDGYDYSEAIILCERILKQSKNDWYREEAKIIMLDCYVKSNLKDKALEIMKSIPVTLTPFELMMRIYDSNCPEYREASEKNIYFKTSNLIKAIIRELDQNIHNQTDEQLISRYLGIEKIIASVYGDDYKEDWSIMHLNHVYIMLISKYIKVGDQKNAFIYLNKLVDDAILYDQNASKSVLVPYNKKWIGTSKVLNKLRELDEFKILYNKL